MARRDELSHALTAFGEKVTGPDKSWLRQSIDDGARIEVARTCHSGEVAERYLHEILDASEEQLIELLFDDTVIRIGPVAS